MVDCFTCGEDITFDKDIRSKTGKQIPLWPDKENAHGHDEQGNPIRQPLPQTAQKQQFYPQTSPAPREPQQRTTTQGGGSLDTKRTLQALMELMNEVREIKAILNSRTILDTNRYEGKNDQIYQVIAPFLNTQGVVASELLDEKFRKEQEQISKWKEAKDISGEDENQGVGDDL